MHHETKLDFGSMGVDVLMKAQSFENLWPPENERSFDHAKPHHKMKRLDYRVN